MKKETVGYCDYCGKPVRNYGHYAHDRKDGTRGVLCFNGDCFTKQFWKDVLDDTVIIVNGFAYHEDTSKRREFCGMTYTVLFNSGEKKTMKLWSNGKIPAEYNAKDNAKFVAE